MGVIGDTRHRSIRREARPEIYANFFQRPSKSRDADMVLRAAAPATLTKSVRAVYEALDVDLPVRFQTLQVSYDSSIARPKFQAQLIGFFAICALILSAAGLFSSMAYSVNRRRREIGIRLALGATPAVVRRGVLMEALRLAAWGIAFGSLLSLAAGRYIASQLFGVSKSDPVLFGGAALTLALTAIVACYIPARNASRTDPITSLRCE